MSCASGFAWFLILIFISFFVAGICFFPYIIVGIFAACISPLKKVSEFLLSGVTFPVTCSENMVAGKKVC
ncbi:hypothetical protein O3M35_012662 [Rhynocoris fuscipes]|uniref:Uncharacterized protein n=1 Tax=Rhynocoris fuscipes TaxID=488301 RepID=A0AAW1CWA6_9HEMI